jgi:hypothetical protein
MGAPAGAPVLLSAGLSLVSVLFAKHVLCYEEDVGGAFG